MQCLKSFLKDDEGASLAEYGLLVGILIVAVAALLTTFGSKIGGAITSASNNLP